MGLKMFLWFSGFTVIGWLAFNIFGIQVKIIKKCAMKLFLFIKDETDLWYPAACKKYLDSVVVKDRIIVVVITVAVLFAPMIAFYGYCFGYFLCWFVSRKATGMNQSNIQESASIFTHYVKEGKEEEFGKALADAVIAANR